MSSKRKARMRMVRISKAQAKDILARTPVRHRRLPDDLVARIKAFEPVFEGVYDRTHEQWLYGFRRDTHPEVEVAIWEAMAKALQTFCDSRPQLTPEARQEAFTLILVRSMSLGGEFAPTTELQHLTPADSRELYWLYQMT